MIHSFDTEIATKVGVNAATIFNNIVFWCDKNKANEKHLHDGKYWTYNSVKAWGELFPYLSDNQIRTALKKLEDEGLIESGNYNQSTYDRTKWYCVKTQMHLLKNPNGFVNKPEPIPDSKPEEKPNTLLAVYKEILDNLNELTGSKYRAASKASQKVIKARLSEGYELKDFLSVNQIKCQEWQGTEFEKYLRPETLYGNKFDAYLNQIPAPSNQPSQSVKRFG